MEGGVIRKSNINSTYYSNTASSLSKRPLGEIYSELSKKKGGEKSALQKPGTKKSFNNITSKVQSGVRKVKASTGQHQSDGLTAKRKDELFGRLSTHALAKFLNRKYDQATFVAKLKVENGLAGTKGSDFNFVDQGYVTGMPHDVRLNKRPITAKPYEKFGNFTQNLFQINNERKMVVGGRVQSAAQPQENTLQSFLSLSKQDIIMLDMRGEGVQAQKEFNEYHIVGSVSFPHGWINRQNHFSALERFKNVEDKVIIIFLENERRGTAIAKVLTEKGFGNIYLLTGGIQQFFIDYPNLIDGYDIPSYYDFKKYVETSIGSPGKK